MTKIVHDVVIFEAVNYELLSPALLVQPKDFGLPVKRQSPTHNPDGFSCTYHITGDSLYLGSLSCSLARPKGWFQKMIYWFKKYPAAINGVKPASENGDVVYDGLSFSLQYTGELIIGLTDSTRIDEIDLDDPDTYVEIITLSFDGGKLSLLIARNRGKLELPRPPSLPTKS